MTVIAFMMKPERWERLGRCLVASGTILRQPEQSMSSANTQVHAAWGGGGGWGGEEKSANLR